MTNMETINGYRENKGLGCHPNHSISVNKQQTKKAMFAVMRHLQVTCRYYSCNYN